MDNIEIKIIKAKELGIKFNVVPAGSGPRSVPYDTMNVVEDGITDEQFCKALDAVIKVVEGRSYMKLLRKHELIK